MGDTTAVTILVTDICVPLDTLEGDVYFLARKRLLSAGLLPSSPAFRVYRRSCDARRRGEIRFVYTVAVTGDLSLRACARISEGAVRGVALSKDERPSVVFGDAPLTSRPVIVGSGPAGLFAALILAENGYRPLVIERGGPVSERADKIRAFEKTGKLDTETNVQFGAGGAGTFSDGKLVTRVNDPLGGYVIDTFARFGAPEEIRYLARPHIGTDYLSFIVDAMVAEIVRLGGDVMFHTRLDGICARGGLVTSVQTSNGEIPAGALILAVGHSARDTYEMMIDGGFRITPKPFSVGVRAEHLQSEIDKALFGNFAGHPALGHAEYHLSHDTARRGVYSFCMCPGGTVSAAASEEGGVVVNGMSDHARGGRNANSAIAVSVFPEDYGCDPRRAIAFQRSIERAAFKAGGGDYAAPVTTMGDFLAGTIGKEPTDVLPTYRAGYVRLAKPEEYLPDCITEALRSAMPAFEKTIPGFMTPSAVLTGAETRTSSPLRILRDPDTRLAVGYRNLYPAGEGAGYAGGITSAAIDGIRSALSLAAVYRPFD